MEQLVLGAASAPAILGLVNVIKPLVSDHRFYPLIAVLCGLAWNVAGALVMGAPLGIAILLGVLAGMGAAGVYDMAKKPETTVTSVALQPGTVAMPVVMPVVNPHQVIR